MARGRFSFVTASAQREKNRRSTKLSLALSLEEDDSPDLPFRQRFAHATPFWNARRFGMEHFLEKLDHDRRLSLRHKVRTDLRVRMRKFDSPEQHAHSENLSQRGVFFTTNLPINKGTSLDLLVEMPKQVTGVPPAQ